MNDTQTKRKSGRKPKRAAKGSPEKTQKKGRPVGSRTMKKPESVGVLTRCEKCQSTEREPYTNQRFRDYEGVDQNGNPYNRVAWKLTKCKNCGQARTDRFYEMIPNKCD